MSSHAIQQTVMELDCQGCAGCCIDWRAIAPDPSDHERRGPRRPLDDAYNLVALTREDAREFLAAGLADALTPRLWHDEDGVEIDGVSVAAIDDSPVFFLGLRKPPKPVAPFDGDSTWLPTCVFLDPTTLQCRIHDSELYPEECAEYPGHNLELDQETECERVERAFGRPRLLDDEPPDELSALLFGPQALGQKLFVFPDAERLDGVVERVVAGELTAEDRALFVAAAVSGSPGTTSVNDDYFERAFERATNADSWAGRAIEDWEARATAVGEDGGSAVGENAGDAIGEDAIDSTVAERVEEERGAPATPGWN